jgi:hypothetical protein
MCVSDMPLKDKLAAPSACNELSPNLLPIVARALVTSREGLQGNAPRNCDIDAITSPISQHLMLICEFYMLHSQLSQEAGGVCADVPTRRIDL